MAEKLPQCGYIYIITSPVLLAMKIGKTSGGSNLLYSRYVTAYSCKLEMYMIESTNINDDEKKVHARLKYANISGELFDLNELENAKKMTKEVTGSKDIIYCNKQYLSLIEKYHGNKDKYKKIKKKICSIQSLPEKDINELYEILEIKTKEVMEDEPQQVIQKGPLKLLEDKTNEELGITQDEVISSNDITEEEYDKLYDSYLRYEKIDNASYASMRKYQYTRSASPIPNQEDMTQLLHNYYSIYIDENKYPIEDIRYHLYLRQRYAILFLIVCGFTDKNDKQKIHRDTIKLNLETNKYLFEEDYIKYYNKLYPHRKHTRYVQTLTMRYMMGIMNSILKNIYGIKIMILSQNNGGKDPDTGHIKGDLFVIRKK